MEHLPADMIALLIRDLATADTAQLAATSHTMANIILPVEADVASALYMLSQSRHRGCISCRRCAHAAVYDDILTLLLHRTRFLRCDRMIPHVVIVSAHRRHFGWVWRVGD